MKDYEGLWLVSIVAIVGIVALTVLIQGASPRYISTPETTWNEPAQISDMDTVFDDTFLDECENDPSCEIEIRKSSNIAGQAGGGCYELCIANRCAWKCSLSDDELAGIKEREKSYWIRLIRNM